MDPSTMIQAVMSRSGQLLVQKKISDDQQDCIGVEVDGRRWLIYPYPDGGGSWVVALPTPLGQPEPGSELLLPLLAGEVFPWVWWTRFYTAAEPLPEAPGESSAPPEPTGRSSSPTDREWSSGDVVPGEPSAGESMSEIGQLPMERRGQRRAEAVEPFGQER